VENSTGLVIIDKVMMTRAQEYLLNAAKEQLALAEKEIPRLYDEFWKVKKSREVFPDVYESMMHTIGYWEGVKNTCKSVMEFMKMSEYDFREFEKQQEIIPLRSVSFWHLLIPPMISLILFSSFHCEDELSPVVFQIHENHILTFS
jgi:hypothetical protein